MFVVTSFWKKCQFYNIFFILISFKARWTGNEWQKNTFARGYLVFILGGRVEIINKKQNDETKNQVYCYWTSFFANSQNSYHFTTLQVRINMCTYFSISIRKVRKRLRRPSGYYLKDNYCYFIPWHIIQPLIIVGLRVTST